MADNRKFKGRSGLNLSSLFGGIGGMMGGEDITPVFDRDGKLTSFTSKGGMANFLSRGAGKSKASDANAGIALSKYENDMRQASAIEMLKQQELAKQNAVKVAMSQVGESIQRLNPKQDFHEQIQVPFSNPSAERIGQDYTLKYGNNFDKGLTEAENNEIIARAVRPSLAQNTVYEAKAKGQKFLADAIINGRNALAKSNQEIETTSGNNALSDITLKRAQENLRKELGTPFVTKPQIAYDTRNGRTSVTSMGDSESNVPPHGVVLDENGNMVIPISPQKPGVNPLTPEKEWTGGSANLAKGGMGNSTATTNASVESKPSQELLKQEALQLQDSIKELSYSMGDAGDAVKIKQMKKRLLEISELLDPSEPMHIQILKAISDSLPN